MSLTMSESATKLTTALLAVQKAVTHVQPDQTNPMLDGKGYASLAAVLDATRSALLDNEVLLIQSPGYEDGLVWLTTELRHSSGEWLRSVAGCPPPQPTARTSHAQMVGVAVTYLRRYALLALLGIATEDTDATPAPQQDPGGVTRLGTAPPAAPPAQPTAEDQGASDAFDKAGTAQPAPATVAAPPADDPAKMTVEQLAAIVDPERKKFALSNAMLAEFSRLNATDNDVDESLAAMGVKNIGELTPEQMLGALGEMRKQPSA